MGRIRIQIWIRIHNFKKFLAKSGTDINHSGFTTLEISSLNAANGTCVALYVPAPHGHSVPLLQGEHAAASAAATAAVASCSCCQLLRLQGFLVVCHAINPVHFVHYRKSRTISNLGTVEEYLALKTNSISAVSA